MLHDRRRETSPRAENPPFVAPLLSHDFATIQRCAGGGGARVARL